MTLSLQGRLYTVAPSMTVSVPIPCAHHVGDLVRVTAEFECAHFDDHIYPSDVEDALNAKMDSDGWERGNCPACVENIPNLAKHDHEDDEADADRGGE